jgi:hypothetical protein
MVKALKLTAVVVIIFCSGVMTGLLLDRVQANRALPAARPANISLGPAWARLEFIRRIQSHLNLTASQQTNIDIIVSEGQNRLRVLWDPIAPQVQEELQQVRQRVLAELNPDQKILFERLSQQRSPRRTEDSSSKNQKKKKESRTNSEPVESRSQKSP